jgi:hypothetical protein
MKRLRSLRKASESERMKDIYYNVQILQVCDYACFFSTGLTRRYLHLTPSGFFIDDIMSFEKN